MTVSCAMPADSVMPLEPGDSITHSWDGRFPLGDGLGGCGLQQCAMWRPVRRTMVTARVFYGRAIVPDPSPHIDPTLTAETTFLHPPRAAIVVLLP